MKDPDSPKVHLAKQKVREILDSPGVYVLYEGRVPYYIGKADRLWRRLYSHAQNSRDRYFYYWNYFSAFVVTDKHARTQIEAILIAAMPSANGARPRLNKVGLPKSAAAWLRTKPVNIL
jgi:hypothetical protein